ncbi:MAG: right-handed parallel beta-helix repeat-containing protein [Thermoplasmata archaeon]|jgi:hypothetical protein|nr:right-handed parallel beta-helix repeat-containing protein [Thermoplasmata archaeon]
MKPHGAGVWSRDRKARGIGVSALLLTVVLSMSSLALIAPSDGRMAHVSAYTSHEPILISGNSDFTSANGVVSGAGTETDPYVISGWGIVLDSVDDGRVGVGISDTDAHFVIRDVSVEADNGVSVDAGVLLDEVSNGTVETSEFSRVVNGISASSSSDLKINGNRFTNAEVIISGSSNISVSQNLCLNGRIWLGFSNNVEVANNTVYGSPEGFGPRPFGIEVYICDSCIIDRNAIGTGYGEEWNRGLSFVSCTNLTVDRNTMAGRVGIDLWGYSFSHFVSLSIGEYNTVRGMPIHYFRNQDNVSLKDQGLGQVIVANCTWVALKRLTFFDVTAPVIMAYCKDSAVTSCNFYNNSDAVRLTQSSNVTLDFNAFWGYSDVRVTDCPSFCFLDNVFEGGSFGTLHISGTDRARIEHNSFSYASNELYMTGCTNCTISGNYLPYCGLRLEGRTTWEVASHSIELNFVYWGPLLYVKNKTDGVISEPIVGQLIVANCSNVSIQDLRTQFSFGLQLLFVDNSTVTNCTFMNSACPITFYYASNVTVRECVFMETYRYTFDFHMAYDLLIYHNNFFGSLGGWSGGGMNYSVEGQVTWDNGYPDGGNYWEQSLHDDNYSGPSQDEPGSDEIVDNPYEVGIGQGADRYPLVNPYGYEPPPGPSVFDQPAFYLGAVSAVIVVSALLSYYLYVKAGNRLEASRSKGEDKPPKEEDE